jgi:hypothetical protein
MDRIARQNILVVQEIQKAVEVAKAAMEVAAVAALVARSSAVMATLVKAPDEVEPEKMGR